MNQQILLSAFTALESAHFYSAFLPSVMTIRKFAAEPEALEALREGEVLATGFALALGLIVSKLTDSPIPFVFSLVVSVSMIGVYEYAIKRTRDSTGL